MKKIINFIKRNLKWIILFCCFIAFLALLEDVIEKEMMKCDVITYNFISRYIINDITTIIMKNITFLGSAIFLILFTIVLMIIYRKKNLKLLIPLNLVIITILNQALKFVIQRPRPIEYRIINESGYSFPSGHSMVSMAFYGLLIYILFKNLKNNKVKWICIALLSLLIILIGFSRIYLGVHYTSDVLAGFLVSISYLILFTKIFDKSLNQ